MKELEKLLESIPQLGGTSEETNPLAYLKFFSTMGRGEWYVMEMEQVPGDLIMFGYVKSPLGEDCDEFGRFTLNQLQEVNDAYGFKLIDLDLKFEPCKIKEVM